MNKGIRVGLGGDARSSDGGARRPGWARVTHGAIGSGLVAAVMLVAGPPAGCAAPAEPPQEEEKPAVVHSEASIKVADDREEGEDESAAMDEAHRRFRARLPKMRAIQERFEETLLTHEALASVGIGLAEDGATPVFKVIVTSPELERELPRSFEGVAVHVRLGEHAFLADGGPDCNGGMGPPCHREQLPLPVEMGNSGAWFQGTACSMGFKACDLELGSSVIVTNSHCAQYTGCNLAGINDPFKHVGPMDEMVAGSAVNIGTIAGHAAPSCGGLNNYTDATKVESAFFQSSKNHRDIGTPKHEIIDPVPGWGVQYSGRTTGHNTGTIDAVNVTVMVPVVGGFCCGALTMKDQISFTPKYAIQGGDSGSGVLLRRRLAPQYDRRIAGLLFAGGPGIGYFNSIGRVMSALDLTFDFTQCGFPDDY